MHDLDEILKHHGVKGMKWGVRQDKKWVKKASSSGKFRKIYNKAVDRLNNGEIAKFNDSPKYRDADLLSNKKLMKEYEKDYSKMVTKEITKVSNEMLGATSPTGKYSVKYDYSLETGPSWKIVDNESQQHSILDTVVIGIIDEAGRLTGVKVDVNGVTHAGVKGMKWGVRKAGKAVKTRVKEELTSRKRERDWGKTVKNIDKMDTKKIQDTFQRVLMENDMKRISKKTGSADRKDYRNRGKLSDAELRVKVERLRAKDNLRRQVSLATKTHRDVGKTLVGVVAGLSPKTQNYSKYGQSIVDAALGGDYK